jgi:colicin import membrane protein
VTGSYRVAAGSNVPLYPASLHGDSVVLHRADFLPTIRRGIRIGKVRRRILIRNSEKLDRHHGDRNKSPYHCSYHATGAAHMDLASDTSERIFAAADALYAQAGRAGFPTVDAVRKTARVNMNDASVGMRAWRRSQAAQAASLSDQVPESVRQASGTALIGLWRHAQDLANASLRDAQIAWEAERAESNTLNKQMADAYETQAAELDEALAEIVRLKGNAVQAAADKARLEGTLSAARYELASARAVTERTEARAIEIERRASELRTELDHAHQDAAQARAELVAMREAHAAEIRTLRGESATALATAASERDNARREASLAHEEAAVLRGQVAALKEQSPVLTRPGPRAKSVNKSKDLR